MDILTFISEVAKALAWPVAVVLLVLMLKKPLTELIPLLRKLKYKELEVEFSKEVAELKANAELPTITSSLEPLLEAECNRLSNLASFSPCVAVIEAWVDVESAATEVASSFWNQGPSDIMRKSPNLGEYLFQCKVINEAQLKTFNKLRELRNKAVQAVELDLSENDAKAYVGLAVALASQIRLVGNLM